MFDEIDLEWRKGIHAEKFDEICIEWRKAGGTVTWYAGKGIYAEMFDGICLEWSQAGGTARLDTGMSDRWNERFNELVAFKKEVRQLHFWVLFYMKVCLTSCFLIDMSSIVISVYR